MITQLSRLTFKSKPPVCERHNRFLKFGLKSKKTIYKKAHVIIKNYYYHCPDCIKEIDNEKGLNLF